MRGSGGWRQHPRRKRCAEFGETGLGLRARRVDRADGAPASAGAAQHVVAEGVLMKLGPIQAGPLRLRGRDLGARRAERRRWCRQLRERLGDERAQPGVGGVGAMKRGEVKSGWGHLPRRSARRAGRCRCRAGCSRGSTPLPPASTGTTSTSIVSSRRSRTPPTARTSQSASCPTRSQRRSWSLRSRSSIVDRSAKLPLRRGAGDVPRSAAVPGAQVEVRQHERALHPSSLPTRPRVSELQTKRAFTSRSVHGG